jgi:hypothetical protein
MANVITEVPEGLDVSKITAPALRVPSVRRVPNRAAVDNSLGLLANLAGTWEGPGFNLIARPDREGGSPLFLELNQTFETLSFDPISSTIPNRGSKVDDISLFGLTYLQKIVDTVTGGALHIEPGIWIHNPSRDVPGKSQSVARMATIPHGNSVLAEGIAVEVNPLPGGTFDPDAISAVNTSPFPVGATIPLAGTLSGFPPYDLSLTTPAAVNFRTPAGNVPPVPLPASILGVSMHKIVQDPAALLTAALKGQTIESMVVINVATVSSLSQSQPGGAAPKDILANLSTGGGAEDIPFLKSNANVATVFATFWLETIKGQAPGETSLQLQYVQTVFLDFPVITPGNPPGANLSWPHVSVATLQKVFGGQ